MLYDCTVNFYSCAIYLNLDITTNEHLYLSVTNAMKGTTKTLIRNKMFKERLNPTLLTLLFSCGLTSCAAFRLIEFELHPATTSSSFTCTDDVATRIEMAAEACLEKQCTEFVSAISLSYSNCTTGNNIEVSGGISVVSTIENDPFQADACINSRLESDECKEIFLVQIPNLSSMTVVMESLTETVAPTNAPQTTTPISTPTGSSPTMTAPQTQSPASMPSLPSSPEIELSSRPSLAPSIMIKEAPSAVTTKIPTLLPTKLNSPISPSVDDSSPVASAPSASAVTTKNPTLSSTPLASAPVTSDSDEGKSKSNTAALGAVFALAGVTLLLLGYLSLSKLRKYKNSQKASTDAAGRGPLDTTDTAFENDEDPEMGTSNRSALQAASHGPKGACLHNISSSTVPLESFNHKCTQAIESEDGNIADNNDSLVLEDDELSSGSSTLFDVNGKSGYDDAASSVFYESHGDEDDEEGTETELDGTWGPDESSIVSEGLNEDDYDEESVPGSTVSSLGASGVENFGDNPSPQQFMEWIKKSPLIPAAAKASIVAAAAAEVAAVEDRKPTKSPVTLPTNFNGTVKSTESGRQSW